MSEPDIPSELKGQGRFRYYVRIRCHDDWHYLCLFFFKPRYVYTSARGRSHRSWWALQKKFDKSSEFCFFVLAIDSVTLSIGFPLWRLISWIRQDTSCKEDKDDDDNQDVDEGKKESDEEKKSTGDDKNGDPGDKDEDSDDGKKAGGNVTLTQGAEHGKAAGNKKWKSPKIRKPSNSGNLPTPSHLRSRFRLFQNVTGELVKEATSVQTGISTLKKQVASLNQKVSQQQKMLGNKESQIKHLEHVLTKTQSAARLHKVEASIDIALQMKGQVSELANVVSKLEKDNAKLRKQNAELNGKAAAYEKENSAQNGKASKILGLLDQIEKDMHKGQDKTPFKQLKKQLASLTNEVDKDIRLDSRQLSRTLSHQHLHRKWAQSLS